MMSFTRPPGSTNSIMTTGTKVVEKSITYIAKAEAKAKPLSSSYGSSYQMFQGSPLQFQYMVYHISRKNSINFLKRK